MFDNTIEKVQWKDAREAVTKMDPQLASIIDKLDVDASYHLYKATYQYGAYIVKNGFLQVPDAKDNNILKDIESSSISRQLKNDLNYNYGSMPAYFVLKNSLEIFLERPHHTYSASIRSQGSSFGGITGILSEKNKSNQPPYLWNITAGFRSIFMLPSIANKRGNEALQKTFGIETGPPAELIDHWSLFCELYNNSNPTDPWNTELMFFSGKWFETMRREINKHHSPWNHLHAYITKSLMNKAGYWINKFVWDAVYFDIREQLDKMPCPYLTNTVESLLDVVTGQVPGIAPSVNDTIGPISTIQTIYKDVYKLENHPTILCPTYLDLSPGNKGKPVYYALKYPSTAGYLKERPTKDKIAFALSKIKELLEHYIEQMTHKRMNVQRTPTVELLKNTTFDYYYTKQSTYPEIQPDGDIPLKDDRFKVVGHYPKDSALTQGCIRIAHR